MYVCGTQILQSAVVKCFKLTCQCNGLRCWTQWQKADSLTLTISLSSNDS